LSPDLASLNWKHLKIYDCSIRSEAVSRQDTESFLRCLENGLRRFGGCPLLLNLDNMKSAVLKADWFDPEINPKLADFCRHYGMHVVPCRPGKPEHKGKVERGVAYLRNNALKGRRFRSIAEENLFLALGKQRRRQADPRHDTEAGSCLFCRGMPTPPTAASLTFSLLSGSSAQCASGQLRRSRKSLLRNAT
jgi:hypothetical protein